MNNLPKGCIKQNEFIVKTNNEKTRYYLPKEIAIEEMQRIHVEKGHLGILKTLLHFSTKYYATNQNQIAINVVNGCDICKRGKKQVKKLGQIGQIGPAKKPFEIIHIDTKGGFSDPKNKLRYCHLAIDMFSRYVWARTSDGQMAKDFIKLIDLIKQDGKPEMIVTDRYGALKSEALKQKMIAEGIKQIFTPTAHPQSNGMVERIGQTLVEKLRCKKIIEPTRSWSVLAKQAIEEYNLTIHCATGYTPAFLLKGYDPDELYIGKDLAEIRELAFTNSQNSHKEAVKRINKKQKAITFEEGDMVYANLADELNKEKLDAVFQGPFKICKVLSDRMYEIQLPNRIERVHIGKLKPYHEPVIM